MTAISHTCRSSPQENRYGCLLETARPLTTETWPVRETLSLPLAKSQILITLSAAPVANHSFPGSIAQQRTLDNLYVTHRNSQNSHYKKYFTSSLWGWDAGAIITNLLTQPMCPEITLNSFQGACQVGLGMLGPFLIASWCPCPALRPASGLDLSIAPAADAPTPAIGGLYRATAPLAAASSAAARFAFW